MQFIMKPFGKVFDPWVWWDDVFIDSELDVLQQMCKSAPGPGIVGEGVIDKDVRRCNVDWLRCNQDTSWVFEKLSNIVSDLNGRYYGFDISGIAEPMQLTHYNSTNEGTYHWHQDLNSPVSRKLTAVLQLTDPSDYEGGELQLFLNNDIITIPKKRGYVAVFPSFTVHQVTPVTKGDRQTLVTWFTGPNFK